MRIVCFFLVVAAYGATVANAEAPETVNMVNFVHAETVNYFARQQDEASVNTFKHEREAINKDNQTIIRSNTDLLYSTAVVDVSEGTTFTLSEGKAFQLMQIIDENHLMPAVIYAGESVTLNRDDLTSGSHVYILMRTAVTAGIDNAHKKQDAAVVESKSAKPYVGKSYDEESLDMVRSAFEADVNSIKTENAFNKTIVDQYQYRLGAAIGWGGLPVEYAAYTSRAGTVSLECSTINFSVPPVNYESGGYWSITTYGPTGWVEVDDPAVDSTTAALDDDGTVTVGFNCPDVNNNIEVVEGWNYGVRLYRPLDTEQITAYTAAFPSPTTR